MFINDYESVFCPILTISLLTPKYHGAKKLGRFFTELSSVYYNPIARYWEPFVEPVKIHLFVDEFSLKLITKETFNVNISETLINVLSSTWKSWSEKPTRLKKRASVFKHSSKVFLNSQQDDEGVCPFSIKNETTCTLNLKRKGDDNVIVIQKDKILEIPVNYQETIHNLLQSTSNNVKLIQGLFEISFDHSPSYLPLKNMNFASIATEYHYVQEVKTAFNYFVCSVKLDRMITHLTIRTPFKLINKTQFNFIICFDEFIKDQGFILQVNESMSIPIEKMSSFLFLMRDNGPTHYLKIKIDSLLERLDKRISVYKKCLII